MNDGPDDRMHRESAEEGLSAGTEEGFAGRLLSDWPLKLTPLGILVVIAFAIFVAEAAVMFLLARLPLLPRAAEAVIDASILLLLLSPTYFVLFLPLKKYYLRHLRADREIRRLSRQMIQVAEEERKGLARDLHDDWGQNLSALQFGLQALRNSLDESPSDLRGRIDDLSDIVGGLSDRLRQVSAGLRPELLESFGIAKALQWQVDQVQKQSRGVAVELAVHGCAARLAPEIEITLFRLCQEGLNNIVKHSGAGRAEIRLVCASGRAALTMRDDGCGFDPSRESAGIGLICMRERVSALGGTLEIRSAPGEGTLVRAELPTPPKETP